MAEGQFCAYCSSPGSSKRCALCREVIYCSQGCQQAHWKEHKRSCSRVFTPSAPSKPAPPKNPCVNCGKEGRQQLGGQWFCSHDCTGGNLASLTEQVKRLSQPQKTSPSAENARLMELIKGRAGPPVEASVPDLEPQPQEDAQRTLEEVRSLLAGGQQKDDQKTLDKVRELIGLAEAPTPMASQPAPQPVPQPAPQSVPQFGDQGSADKIRALIGNAEKAPGHAAPQPMPQRRPGSQFGDQGTMDKVRTLIGNADKAPVPELQPRPDDQRTMDKVRALIGDADKASAPELLPESPQPDDQQTMDKVRSLIGDANKAASAAAGQPEGSWNEQRTFDTVRQLIKHAEDPASLQSDDPGMFGKVKGLIEGSGGVDPRRGAADNQFTAQENQRVTEWIRGICNRTPEENYAEAKARAEERQRLQKAGAGTPPPAATNRAIPLQDTEEEAKTAKKKRKPRHKSSTKAEEAKQEVELDEVTRQLQEIEAKKEELRRTNQELLKAKEKQAQMNHYMRGWLQREVERRSSEEADEIDELD